MVNDGSRLDRSRSKAPTNVKNDWLVSLSDDHNALLVVGLWQMRDLGGYDSGVGLLDAQLEETKFEPSLVWTPKQQLAVLTSLFNTFLANALAS